MSKADKLKERLMYFVKESTTETSLKVPIRAIGGFKLDIVSVTVQDLLQDKYHNSLQFVNYEPTNDGYVFNYKEKELS